MASIDDAGVTIRHSEGSARLRFDDLDAGQRSMFGLEGDLAAAAEAVESSDSAEYERWVDTRMASIRNTEQRLALAARRDDSSSFREWQAVVARQLAIAQSRALARPASAVGSGSWAGSYPRYRTYRPSYRTVWTPAYYPACRGITSVRTNSMTTTGPARKTSFANTVLKSIP